MCSHRLKSAGITKMLLPKKLLMVCYNPASLVATGRLKFILQEMASSSADVVALPATQTRCTELPCEQCSVDKYTVLEWGLQSIQTGEQVMWMCASNQQQPPALRAHQQNFPSTEAISGQRRCCAGEEWLLSTCCLSPSTCPRSLRPTTRRLFKNWSSGSKKCCANVQRDVSHA